MYSNGSHDLQCGSHDQSEQKAHEWNRLNVQCLLSLIISILTSAIVNAILLQVQCIVLPTHHTINLLITQHKISWNNTTLVLTKDRYTKS